MKQTYQHPATMIVAIAAQRHLLAGSGVATGSAVGQQYTSTDVTYSRRSNSSDWDDEEE